MKINKKSESGITLVSLVITITVVMILSGITVNMALGEEGFLRNSKNQETKMNEIITNKQEELKVIENEFLDSL